MPTVFRAVDPQPSFPQLELEVLERWRARDVFAESLRRREGAEQWVFYEGPPTANGPPGSHHVLARVFKDIYPRYRTMRGYRVERKGGWDCHGLAVEIAVEQQLGFTNKMQIEEYGIEKFNRRCSESVSEFLEEWNRLTERIGFWLDLDAAYRTLDPSYIESVWWALEQIHARGLLYESHRVVPYCPRCGTALSSHEVSQGYQDVEDASVYVKLPLLGSAQPESLLVWTTTPWTLPGNLAAAVGPAISYARVRVGEETLIVAEALVERVFGEGAEVLGTMRGSELVGRSYASPIFELADRPAGGSPVLAGEFVTTEDGTGIVHMAPAFGEDDFRVGVENGLFDPTNPHTLYNPVTREGTYDARVVGYEGRSVNDPQLIAELIAGLRERGLLFREEPHEHSYPHCWRCGTRLLYYAKPSWYIATSRLRDRLLAANETVNWYPPHIKHGRFGDWLAGNVDWALSRERYWGTPLPIWRCSQAPGHRVCIGSFAELERRSGTAVGDPHRPFVDALTFPCEQCGGEMRRVPEVIDVWFDSGSMPFAQHHAPFENLERYEQAFPADFVCEALDQTRGWFYSLIAISTLLNDRAPYRNAVCLGLLVDGDGQKMSKSKGNVVVPWDVIDRFGADAFRWYFFTSKQPWDGYRFSVDAVGEAARGFLRQLWNVYAFFVLYANAGDGRAGAPNDLDGWALSRLAATVATVGERLEAYDATSAGREIAAYVEDLSNWYVRRSRRRFWDGDGAALATLRTVLNTLAKLLAPFTPFIADELYDNLDGELASVHLCDFPDPGERDLELEFAMTTARETVRLGLAARSQGDVKVRQPLREAIIVADGRERAAIERLAEVVREELNVLALRFVAAADELGTYTVKPNFRTLGPRFGKRMPQLAAAVAALEPAAVAAALRDGRTVTVTVGGGDHELGADDLALALAPLAGYGLEREGSHAVALDLTLDAELLRAGDAREIVHAIQACRKSTGLEITDRIELALGGDPALLDAAREHEPHIARETLATAVAYAEPGTGGERDGWSAAVEIGGRELKIRLARV
ncbi:MAG TPA: isoleucine--tRNA ligase [Solirubrobacteraceae bacterium]|nr:isoleucine--tRNA ligase [Solirubrobacteraceae bacterium]